MENTDLSGGHLERSWMSGRLSRVLETEQECAWREAWVPVLVGPGGDWARRGVGCVYGALTAWALRFAEREPDSKMGRGGEKRGVGDPVCVREGGGFCAWWRPPPAGALCGDARPALRA